MTPPVRRAIVTGGAGFIGRSLVSRLAADGAEVIIVDRAEPQGLPEGTRAVVIDLAETSALADLLRQVRPDAVFHLAASRARSSDLSAFRPSIEANLLGTLSVVEAMAAADTDTRLVAVGTAEEYGSAPVPYAEEQRELPVSAYSLSKLAMTRMLETLARVDGFPAVVVRPSVAYGPGQAPDMFIPALVSALVEGREFPMTAGEQTRDFVYVDDLVDALVRAAVAPAALGRVINAGSGESVTVREVALLAEQLAGVSGLVRAGAVAYRPGEQMAYAIDTTRAEELLGWRATTSLEEGLRRTIDAARARG